MQQSTASSEFLHTILMTNLINIYDRFENIDIRNDGGDLVYIEYYAR